MSYDPIKIKKLMPLRDGVIVKDMNFSERTTSLGIILAKDDMKSSGIRPRWGQVYAIGPDQKEISVGQWICVAHGRWTRGVKIEDHDGVKVIRRIDVNDILLVSEEQPSDDTISDAV